jgi:hypothetical protein
MWHLAVVHVLPFRAAKNFLFTFFRLQLVSFTSSFERHLKYGRSQKRFLSSACAVGIILSGRRQSPELRQVPLAENFLPTRLIDVGPSNGSREPILRITKNHRFRDLKYIALSYRWSPPNPNAITNESSLPARLREIPLSSLPQLFKDVITICRCLDVQYLWIDALCIVQVCLS